MLPSETQLELCELMERNELAVSSLYKAYAILFPQHKAIWQRLAQDEIGHAEQIRDLTARAKDGMVHFDAAHERTMEEIKVSIDRIAQHTERAEKKQTILSEAVSIALELEKNMLEDEWFKCFQGDSEVSKRVLLVLAEETSKHLHQMEAFYATIMASQPEAQQTEEKSGGKPGIQRLSER